MDNLTLQLIISNYITDDDLASLTESDWHLLIQNAHVQGVGAIVYWTLSKSGMLSIAPESARHSLRTIYSSTWLQNQRIIKELEILNYLFSQNEIPVVVLKGACFALTIYPDIGLRPMVDLDLLIPESKIARAVQVAKLKGYEEIVPDVYPGLTKFLKGEFALLKKGKEAVTLEFHNSLLQNTLFTYSVPTDWFWQQTMLFNGSMPGRFENLLMFTPEANVLYVAAHTILKHGSRGAVLRQFYDLDRLISLNSDLLNWNLIISQAKKFEWGSALYEALNRTHEYFDTFIPKDVFTSLSETTDRHQSLIAKTKIKPKTRVQEEYQKLLSLKWYGRILVFLELVVPGPSYMRWRYKLKTSWILPWYYLVRWWGILKDGLRTFVALFAKR